MSISVSQIQSQVSIGNISNLKPNGILKTGTGTLTIGDKNYTISISNNRITSAVRSNPSGSNWDKFKTSLAKFFGTRNSDRIPRALSNMDIPLHKKPSGNVKFTQDVKNTDGGKSVKRMPLGVGALSQSRFNENYRTDYSKNEEEIRHGTIVDWK